MYLLLCVLFKNLPVPKGYSRDRNSKKGWQHNGQKEKDKKINNVNKTLHRKLKIKQQKLHLKVGWAQVLGKGKQFLYINKYK